MAEILTWQQIADLNTPQRGTIQDIAANYGGIDYESPPSRLGDCLMFTVTSGMAIFAMKDQDGSWRECTIDDMDRLEKTIAEYSHQ